MKPVALLQLSLRPSRSLLLVELAAHLAAAGAVLAATLPSWQAILLLLLIGTSLARLRGISPVATLLLHGDGRLETADVDGAPCEAGVHPHTLVLPFLVVLLYRQEGRLRAMTVLADSLAAEDFRQLRLWLRWRSSS